jgi:transposase-like protein
MHIYIEQPAATQSPESDEVRELREQLDELKEQNAALGAIARQYKAHAEVHLRWEDLG